MKKILLIGKLTNLIQDFNESLSERFHVQICPNLINVVQDMMKTLRPNLVILSTAGWDDADVKVFELFCNSYKNIPVLLVGTDNNRWKFKKYYTNERFSYMEGSITKKQLMERCYELMNVETPEPEEESPAELRKDKAQEATVPDKKHVLVVDDSPILLRSVKSMLEKTYKISVATSGEQALKLVGKKQPDLILLDYEMPGYDGKKTLELLRENPNTSNIPVIFLTGVSDKEHVVEVLALKPEGYILKPPNKEKMLRGIREALTKEQSEE